MSHRRGLKILEAADQACREGIIIALLGIEKNEKEILRIRPTPDFRRRRLLEPPISALRLGAFSELEPLSRHDVP